jgi:hypothetical protein
MRLFVGICFVRESVLARCFVVVIDDDGFWYTLKIM